MSVGTVSAEGSMAAAAREYSAGGVVTQNGRLLLVRVENLQGEVLWTFPKGHLEPGETPRRAALREVEEETGYRCRILKTLMMVRYRYFRSGRRIDKKVRWYWMTPEARPGGPDPDEILDIRWANPESARRLLRYPGDHRLLERVALLAERET
ncbi:MAG: NUDIX domain-containing protein [Elusimicrobia bacterium]|nr:NUDIX domain-containing protein [Elusimicrobiota bacterium]